MGNASAISSPLLQGSGCGQVGAISWSVLCCSSSHFLLMSWSLFACGTGGKGTCFLSNSGTGWSSFNPWLLLDSPFSNFLQPWPLIICRRPFKTPSLLLLLVSPLQVACALAGCLRLLVHVKLYPRLGSHCHFFLGPSFYWRFHIRVQFCLTKDAVVDICMICMHGTNQISIVLKKIKNGNFDFRRIQFCF